MLSLSWYLQYTLRTIQRGGRYTLLAIFCLGTGIALLVSLQTLGLCIKDSLATSGQLLLGADLAVSNVDEEFEPRDELPFAVWRADHELLDYTTLYVTQVQAKKEAETALFDVRVVDPVKYPLHGQVPIANPPGGDLSTLLSNPNAIVISEQIAKRLQLTVGDEIEVVDSRASRFRIAGIVPPSTNSPLSFDNAAIQGIGYLSRKAAASILPVAERNKSRQLLVKTTSPAQTQALVSQIEALSKSYQVRVAETELVNSIARIKGLDSFLVYVGLLALLTSGIAIADTMLATVTRRQEEIAILKTLGLNSFDLVALFTLEAALRGLIGAFVGIVLGTSLGLAMQVFAEQFIGQPIEWRVHSEPVLDALLIGPSAAVAFGLLPILAASGIRPIWLIRRQLAQSPQASYWVIFGLVLLITGIMGGIAGLLLSDWIQGEALAYGTLLGLLLLVLLFFFALWLAEKLIQSLGRRSLDLQMAVRSLSRRRVRSVITLTTLSIGIFAIGLIAVLGDLARTSFVEERNREIGYNLIVYFRETEANRKEVAQLEAAPGLLELALGNMTTSEFLRVNHVAAKALIDQHMNELRQPRGGYGLWGAIQGRALSQPLPDVNLVSGRSLTAADAGRRVLLVPDRLAHSLGLKIGDELVLGIEGMPVDFTVVGIFDQGDWLIAGGGFITSRETITNLAPHARGVYRLRIQDQQLETATRSLTMALPDAWVIGNQESIQATIDLFDRLAVLPSLIAALSLLVGSVMIANSVSLVTLQRYEEIGILKALGASGVRIFCLMWLENNVIGLLGIVIGVGFAVLVGILLGPSVFGSSGSMILSAGGLITPSLVALLVIGLATVIAVWPTVNIRPAVALRNE